MTSPQHRAAQGFARRGLFVFPCSGKRPLTDQGLRDATLDRRQVDEWWRRWPNANVAIATGTRSRIVVLDVDGEEGSESLRALEREHGALPLTASVNTPRGGSHFYFRHRGGEIRNSVGKLGPGLDVRGDGGYVVAPPSLVNGRCYAWDDEASIAELPHWLLALMRRERRGEPRPASEWRKLVRTGVAVGERNHRTAQLAGYLLSRGIDTYVAIELIVAWDARNRPPLGRDEVTRTVGSIADREARKRTRGAVAA